MSNTNKLKKGDRVLWEDERGERWPATVEEPIYPSNRVMITLDDKPLFLSHGSTKKFQTVSQDQLTLRENLQSTLQKAERDRLYAAHFLEEALERQGCSLTDKQKVIAWAALEHILLKEKLGLGWP